MSNDYYQSRGCQSIAVTVPSDTLMRIKSVAKDQKKCVRHWCNEAIEALIQAQLKGRVFYCAPMTPGAGCSLQFWIERPIAEMMRGATDAAGISNRAWVYTALILALKASANTASSPESQAAVRRKPKRPRDISCK